MSMLLQGWVISGYINSESTVRGGCDPGVGVTVDSLLINLPQHADRQYFEV